MRQTRQTGRRANPPSECMICATGLARLWGVQPALFQHAGIANTQSAAAELRVSDAWDEAGDTVRAVREAVRAG